jgi:hypothetical protein
LNALLLVDYNDKFQILYFEQTYFWSKIFSRLRFLICEILPFL